MSEAWLSPSNNSNKRAIREVQLALGLHPDGQYSRSLVAQVSDFQATNKLEVDGLVGPITWAALHGTKPEKPKKKAPKKIAIENPYVVYFDFDSTTIADMESVRIITAAAKAAKSNKSTRIEVTGHTDTSGASDYNQILSEARAKVVDEALIALGINRLIIKRHASGENDPGVNTGDGVREGKNRRVEINVR